MGIDKEEMVIVWIGRFVMNLFDLNGREWEIIRNELGEFWIFVKSDEKVIEIRRLGSGGF